MGAEVILQKLPAIGMTLLTFYIVGMTIYIVYLFINRKDQSILPPTDAWWWPSSLNKYIHVYPRNYNYLSNVTAPTSFVSNTYSNVSTKNCKLKCEESPDDCVGFESNLASNTCVTYSSVGFPVEYTGNNIYVVEGNEPTDMYKTYKDKRWTIPNALASNIAAYISTSYIDCSSNCSSNVTCLGFEYNSGTNNCVQRTTMDTSNLVASTATTSYILMTAVLDKSPI